MLSHGTKKIPENDFRYFLQRKFVERCRKNPSYSLRSFARSLGIEASPLSAILRGKRPLTEKMKLRLGQALGLNSDELSRFRVTTEKPRLGFQQLSLDHYALIADWYHYAILELIKIPGFEPSTASVAKALGIKKNEAHIAVERLQRVGLLEISSRGTWRDLSEDGLATNITDGTTSSAAKALQQQILEMAKDSLLNHPLHLRNHTSMTMAIHPDDLPEATEKIKEFRRSLCAYFEKNKKPTQIYQLGICLYPVTNLEN